jgi:EamA domain-containing membrane protein RarD
VPFGRPAARLSTARSTERATCALWCGGVVSYVCVYVYIAAARRCPLRIRIRGLQQACYDV